MLGEIKLRGRFESIHSAAQIDLIAVQGEDLLLGEGAFDLYGEVGFLKFTYRSAVGREEQVAGQLHGERGSALSTAMSAQVVPYGSSNAKHIDAPVGFKGLIFDGDNSLAKDWGETVVVDDDPTLECEGANNTALLIVKGCRCGGAVALEIVNLRQIRQEQ